MTIPQRRRALLMALAVLTVVVALVLHPVAGLRAGVPGIVGLSVRDDPLTVAHRGASAQAPENTLAALRLAIEQGADFVETDVRLTRDGIPVLLHDAELDRTTDGSGDLSETTFAELARLDAGSWFAGSTAAVPARSRGAALDASARASVPTLAEFLKVLSSGDAAALLELKGDWDPADVVTIRRLLDHYDVRDRVVLASFRLGSLEATQRVLPGVPRILLAEEPRSRELERARQVGASGIAVGFEGIDASDEPDRWFDSVAASGLLALVYTVDDAADWERLASWPVYAVVTDRAAAHREWTAARGE